MEALGPPCIFRRSSSDVVQVWLQSRQTRLTLRMPTRAVSLWQVNDLTLLLPGSELMVTNEDNDGPGAHLFTFFGCMGWSMFTRRGHFWLRTWFYEQRCMFCLNKGL